MLQLPRVQQGGRLSSKHATLFYRLLQPHSLYLHSPFSPFIGCLFLCVPHHYGQSNYFLTQAIKPDDPENRYSPRLLVSQAILSSTRKKLYDELHGKAVITMMKATLSSLQIKCLYRECANKRTIHMHRCTQGWSWEGALEQ